MTKKEFNKIRSKLEMQLLKTGSMKPKTNKEKFVMTIIEKKHAIDKEVEDYEGND